MEDIKNPPKAYSTNDLDIAAYLLANSYRIVKLEGKGSNITFVFDDSEGRVDDTVLRFYSGEKIAASTFADCQRRVRDIMWQRRRRSERIEDRNRNGNIYNHRG